MTDRAYIVSRTLELKIAIAENNDLNTLNVSIDVLKEILAILKEQEPLPVRYVDQGESYPPCVYHSVCRACGGILNYPEKFCKACGRGVIWVPFCKEEADVCSER